MKRAIKKRYILFATVVILMMVGGLWFVLSEKDGVYVGTPVRETGPIIVFGDSLVAGVGATPGNDFVSLLEKRFDMKMVNKGVSGNTTEDALKRLNEDVLSYNPRLVIVLLGGNDALKRVPHEQTFSNLRSIIEQIQKNDAVVLLLGIRGGIIRDGYKKQFERLADEKNVSYVPDVLDGVIGNNELMSDQIHPNDHGYRIIAERVGDLLVTMMHGSER